MSASAPSPAGPGHHPHHKPTRILACVLCQHRKIKCDRSFPCANCLKAKVTCTPSTPAPARKRRRPNQDLQERLARCEELLKEYATAKPEDGSMPSPSSQQLSDREREIHMRWRPAGRLVREESGVKFVDSFLLGTVYDELKAMRDIIDDEDYALDEPTPDNATPADAHDELLMGSEFPMVDLEDCRPAPGHIFRLWQIFLERVNPLTKVIHVPSLQPYLVEATAGSQHLPKSVEALLFSIYTLATVSMNQEECQSLLGLSRDAAIQRYSAGVRITLSRAGFLKNHTFETLQALVIYLISLQNRYNPHAVWVLNGVVFRIAQKMGLHRDGEALGLSPFETEMRRRVWWQILMLDAKYSMLSGLNYSQLPRHWDTKEPKNVNDADLFPMGTEPIQDREGPTEMIIILITNKVARFFNEVPGMEPIMLMTHSAEPFKGVEGAPTKEHIETYRKKLGELGVLLVETIDRFCDPTAGALHEMALDIKFEIVDKLQNLLLPPENQQFNEELETPSDHAFKIAVGSIAHGIEKELRTADKSFAWFSRLHFQLNLFQYMVGQLSYRTTGQLVDKAWEIIPQAFELYPELLDITRKDHLQTAIFTLKAWRKRVPVLREQLGCEPEIPEYIAKLQRLVPQEEMKSELASSTNPTPTPGPSRQMTMNNNDASKQPAMPQQDQAFDNLLGSYLDVNSIDWDMWGNMVPANTAMAAFGGFGMGPTTEW